ncbi:DUF4439 domain-containing protein [Nocardioides gilvus]|uniref:DUF4439 domain-containing protein n=1 Tax=Nocardioides gilvus TaxID=1735589 RepID=UPI000D749602|nr:DUF4439 domain-containing protein [Nocardioides gilvus]
MSTTSALQDSLGAEHATVHLFAALGGITSVADDPVLHALLTARHRAHRGRREYLTSVLRGLGVDPVAAQSAYLLPTDLSTATAVRASGTESERRCAQTYAALVGQSTDDVRTWAIAALTESAVALTQWGAPAEPFPGAPEL